MTEVDNRILELPVATRRVVPIDRILAVGSVPPRRTTVGERHSYALVQQRAVFNNAVYCGFHIRVMQNYELSDCIYALLRIQLQQL